MSTTDRLGPEARVDGSPGPAADGEGVHTSHGYDIRYKFRAASGDRRHLIVVFTGIKTDGDYDFDGRAAAGCKAAMLWIADDFGGENAYYMSHAGDRGLADGVDELIRTRLSRLGLTARDCTLMGFSKGASAALYYGTKYGYANIVASVPQIKVGSFARDTYPKIYAHMTASGSVEDCVELNGLIPEAVRLDADLAKNIYLFSSVDDSQFGFHLKPFVPELLKYENFNMIMTKSSQVTHHGEVTHYNVPLILSIIYALSEGIAPRFGLTSNGAGEPFDYSEIKAGGADG